MPVGNIRLYGKDTLQYPSLIDIYSLCLLYTSPSPRD